MTPLIVSILTLATLAGTIALTYFVLTKFKVKFSPLVNMIFTIGALISLITQVFFYMDWGNNINDIQWWVERTLLLMIFGCGISVRILEHLHKKTAAIK